MKPIKFRGKRKDTGEWVYGGFMQTPEATFIVDYSVIIQKAKDGYPAVYDVVEVDPETVGQFTGLYDKNGKEIYEGDILCVTSDVWCSKNESLLVVWIDHFAGYGLKRKGFDFTGERTSYPTCLSGITGSPKMEVIGNIHKNPELLK